MLNIIPSCFAILTLAFLEWQAIIHDINGQTLSMVIAAIAGIAGYKIAKTKRRY